MAIPRKPAPSTRPAPSVPSAPPAPPAPVRSPGMSLTPEARGLLDHIRAYAKTKGTAYIRPGDLPVARELEAAGLVTLHVDRQGGHAKLR